jgi:hypothetical protein
VSINAPFEKVGCGTNAIVSTPHAGALVRSWLSPDRAGRNECTDLRYGGVTDFAMVLPDGQIPSKRVMSIRHYAGLTLRRSGIMRTSFERLQAVRGTGCLLSCCVDATPDHHFASITTRSVEAEVEVP